MTTRCTRRPRCNLLMEGALAASDYVTRVLRATRGAHIVTVSEDGKVTITPRCKLTTADYDAWVQRDTYLGTYDRHGAQTGLESDLDAKERELRAAMRKRKAA